MKINRLFSEDGKNLSLGRVTFWALFPLMMYYWTYAWIVLGKDTPSSLTTAFVTIMGYNLGKKFTSNNEKSVPDKSSRKTSILDRDEMPK